MIMSPPGWEPVLSGRPPACLRVPPTSAGSAAGEWPLEDMPTCDRTDRNHATTGTVSEDIRADLLKWGRRTSFKKWFTPYHSWHIGDFSALFKTQNMLQNQHRHTGTYNHSFTTHYRSHLFMSLQLKLLLSSVVSRNLEGTLSHFVHWKAPIMDTLSCFFTGKVPHCGHFITCFPLEFVL